MKNLLIVAALAAAGYFAWQKWGAQPPPPPVAADPNKTPGAHMENRINNLSGMAPDP